MKSLKKLSLIFGSFVFLLIAAMVIVYNSPIGEKILKSYISSKLELLKKFEIDSFNYKWNSFSLILKKGSNYIYIYGDIFPFDATYESNLNNLEEISKDFTGSLESKGTIKYNDYAVITGNSLFANGYGDLKFQCNNTSCVGIFNGKEFDTQKLFHMVKLYFPYLIGQNDLNIVLKKAFSNIYFNFKGKFNYKDLIIIPKTYITANVKLFDKQNYEMNLKNKAKVLTLDVDYKKKNNKIIAKAQGSINLSILRKILLYPVIGRENMNFYYDNIGDILKFSSSNFKGYYSKNKINIQLSNLSSEKFFDYLNLKKLCHGVVNGDIIINSKEGIFNIIFNNCILRNDKIIRYIQKIVKKDIKHLKVVFLKGEFDKKRVIFNVLGKNKNLIISIQKGVYFYNGTYRYTIDVIVDNKYKYVFDVDNNGIKLVKSLKSYKIEQEVLVY